MVANHVFLVIVRQLIRADLGDKQYCKIQGTYLIVFVYHCPVYSTQLLCVSVSCHISSSFLQIMGARGSAVSEACFSSVFYACCRPFCSLILVQVVDWLGFALSSAVLLFGQSGSWSLHCTTSTQVSSEKGFGIILLPHLCGFVVTCCKPLFVFIEPLQVLQLVILVGYSWLLTFAGSSFVIGDYCLWKNAVSQISKKYRLLWIRNTTATLWVVVMLRKMLVTSRLCIFSLRKRILSRVSQGFNNASRTISQHDLICTHRPREALSPWRSMPFFAFQLCRGNEEWGNIHRGSAVRCT